MAFKYWVIAQEMPKVLGRQPLQHSNERKYKVFNGFGIVLNLVVCIWLAIEKVDSQVKVLLRLLHLIWSTASANP